MKRNKSSKNSIKRRDFIKKTAAASSIFIVPRDVLGGKGYIAPSDKLVLAAIGSGGKGASDISNSESNGKEKIVALCDVDLSGSAKETIKKYPKAKKYEDFREMLDKEKDIDAVTISTPDHTHASVAANAMKRGIHVYVQKPLTHNIYEARLLTELARENKVVTQMGNQGASNPDQLKIQEWINDKKIGNISVVNVWTDRPIWPSGIPMPKPNTSLKPNSLNWDLWLGPAKKSEYIPEMHPFNWRGWWDYGTGALGDMGCHLIDVPFKALSLKYPKSVECSIGKILTGMYQTAYTPSGCPPSAAVSLTFGATEKNDTDIQMTWMDGGIKPFHPEFLPADVPIDDGGVIIIGENGVKLSGGQKQRLSIARAILKKSPIILLDEATSSLDADSEEVVQNAILNLTKNKTTLVIAHRLSTIHKADKIFVLKNGGIIDAGNHDHLIKNCEEYKSLYNKQLK